MPKRTDWLTEFARPLAEDLAARCGSLKKVMSAGVMALDSLTPEDREYFMAKADGVNVKPATIEANFRKKVLAIVKDAQAIPVRKKPSRKAKPAESG